MSDSNVCSKCGWWVKLCHCNGVGRGLTVIGDMQPAVTEDLTGSPIVIRSKRHKRDLMKRHGVVEYDRNSSAVNRKLDKRHKDKNFEWRKNAAKI